MNDTCTTHRSSSPHGGASEGLNEEWQQWKTREDQAWNFSLCFVCRQSSVRGWPLFICIVYFIIKKNKKSRAPVPGHTAARVLNQLSGSHRGAMRWYWTSLVDGPMLLQLLLPVSIICVTLVPKPGRKEGHAVREPSAAEGDLRCWGDRAAGRSETASGLPEAVVLGAKEEQVGRKTRWPCSWVEEVWLPSGGSGGVRPVRLEAEACCIRHVWGRSRERGLRCRLPSPEEPPPSARRRGASGRPPKMSSTIAWRRGASEPLSCWGTERQWWSGNRTRFFFPLSPSLVSVTPHPSVSFSLASSVLTPRYAAAALTGSPGRGGGGGVERSLGSTPRPASGDGSMWRVGRGREPWNGARPVE